MVLEFCIGIGATNLRIAPLPCPQPDLNDQVPQDNQEFFNWDALYRDADMLTEDELAMWRELVYPTDNVHHSRRTSCLLRPCPIPTVWIILPRTTLMLVVVTTHDSWGVAPAGPSSSSRSTQQYPQQLRQSGGLGMGIGGGYGEGSARSGTSQQALGHRPTAQEVNQQRLLSDFSSPAPMGSQQSEISNADPAYQHAASSHIQSSFNDPPQQTHPAVPPPPHTQY
ncbi:hypothetical protein B9479_004469 [Cryptococcus floricola]|uniref:Uncharacterized protein n=1 Tax=Cryptococcus floricola TaxID=2591691 RepID=A0A5D3ATR8_9TREE|nr:hypothetical protein B9479_004469 [Cryptococcus floricola]